MGAENLTSTVTGVEMFRKILDRGEAGNNVGLLLHGINRKDICRGMIICKKGSVMPHCRQQQPYSTRRSNNNRDSRCRSRTRIRSTRGQLPSFWTHALSFLATHNSTLNCQNLPWLSEFWHIGWWSIFPAVDKSTLNCWNLPQLRESWHIGWQSFFW